MILCAWRMPTILVIMLKLLHAVSLCSSQFIKVNGVVSNSLTWGLIPLSGQCIIDVCDGSSIRLKYLHCCYLFQCRSLLKITQQWIYISGLFTGLAVQWSKLSPQLSWVISDCPHVPGYLISEPWTGSPAPDTT